MMKYIYLIICLLILAGCTKEAIVRVDVHAQCVEEKQRERFAKFVVDCSKAANPMSDEEGEDLVAQCERTGKRILCPPTKFCQLVINKGFPDGKSFGAWSSDCDGLRKIAKKYNEDKKP